MSPDGVIALQVLGWMFGVPAVAGLILWLITQVSDWRSNRRHRARELAKRTARWEVSAGSGGAYSGQQKEMVVAMVRMARHGDWSQQVDKVEIATIKVAGETWHEKLDAAITLANDRVGLLNATLPTPAQARLDPSRTAR